MTDIEKAKNIYSDGGFSCVMCRGEDVITSTESGIKPLMKLCKGEASLCGFSAADKIVGKAAAFLYAKMGVTAVYADVLSVAGESVLKKYGIAYSYNILTEKIINRLGTGICPMESAVESANDFESAYSILLDKIH